MCVALWGDYEISWESYPSFNSVGGILCIWNAKSFKVENKISGSGFIMVIGKWRQETQPVHIINIYSPFHIQNKRELWDSVKQLKNQYPGGYWCILWDFNNIKTTSERMGTCQRGLVDGSIREFNEWIEELKVEEVSWVGKQFTWFKPNGTADRFLVSPKWLSKWHGSSQFTLRRNFSDHCPVMLRSKCVDWGPKPFRILDCWLSDNSFKKVVHDSWSLNNQSGWGGYVLK